MRRRKNSSEIGNLDSLMDTMTNVVGILLILLILTQLSVGDAVKRIKGIVDEIDPAVVVETTTKLADLTSKVSESNATLAQLTESTTGADVKLSRHQAVIARLNLEIEQISEAAADPNELKTLVEERRRQADELEKQLSQAQAEIAQLKAQLDETPVPEAGEAVLVSLPNPRAAPAGAEPALYFCRYGRVVSANIDILRGIAQKEIMLAKGELIKGDKLECEKLVALFENKNIGNTFVRCNILVSGPTASLYLISRPDAGDTTEDLRKATDSFRKSIRDLDPRERFVRFYVWPDSFDTYVEAREIVARTKRNLAAGWIANGEGAEFSTHLGFDPPLTCSSYTPPPPPPPMPTPTTPPPPKPKSDIPDPVQRPLPGEDID